MKKLLILLVLAVSVLLCSLTQAADKVVVIPLGGTNVYIDPRNIVSVYANPTIDADPSVVLTVPSDKHFVLTDITGSTAIHVYENDTIKLHAKVGGYFKDSTLIFGYPQSITISSGVVFSSGSQVKVKCSGVAYEYYTHEVTLSGYYY